jgi:hypothetical protein
MKDETTRVGGLQNCENEMNVGSELNPGEHLHLNG